MSVHTPDHTSVSDKPGIVMKPKEKMKSHVRTKSIIMLLTGTFFTLFTYQYFHHGLWGKLNNYNKLPMVTMQGTTIKDNNLVLTLYRPDGPDTYGSFIEKITVSVPGAKTPVETWTPSNLASIASKDIVNSFKFQKVHTGPWGLVVPLAAKATVKLPLSDDAVGEIEKFTGARVTVQDVSGTSWTYDVPVK